MIICGDSSPSYGGQAVMRHHKSSSRSTSKYAATQLGGRLVQLVA
uniref:Uncharacterized protein n=1 Tax=Siphoviridae sp. ctxfQ4 TaxID=2826521 RepID=A0A8S5N792_9CAUD|nr:MAG TPA: hypothetical protein [Siphoviridae sp. ctxfQ4]